MTRETLPISVLLLARDETAALESLLPALAFAREVVVVWDPRGAAATRSAATRLGARVIERPFDGFGAQRQFALAQCREPWVLWLDADERPAPGFEAALAGAIARGVPGAVRREGWFLGRRIRHCGWQAEWIVRLFRREGASFDDAPVHERLVAGGEGAERLAGARLEHHSYPDWGACVDKLVRYARAGADGAWRRGRRAGPLDVLLRPPLRFVRMYLLQGGVLDGAHGLVLCALASAQVALKYGELWARGGRAPRP